jgi:membrane-bound lytic murein transglycosylase D
MTTRPDAQHGATAGLFYGLTLSLLLLAGCASAPMTESPPAPQTASTDAAASAPAGAKGLDDAAASGAAAAAAATAASDVVETVVAPVPVDPLRPDVRLDLDDRSARVDLWDRVRRGFAMSDLDNDLVRDRERWYASRPDYVARMTERGGRYLFYIVEELDKRHMPTELALLPFIESAYNPQAMSVASAAGMWQFIPSTGRDFELKQTVFRDDRRSVLDSTRAALDYLQKLYGMFGDWHLALAAYNWGEGSVQRAVAKNQRAGLPTDYQSLHMPLETQGYVPKLQAVKNIIARPADFNLTLPELLNHPYFLSVPIERDIDVAVAVKLSGMQAEEFQNLNPQMNRPVILASGTPQVLLPYDNANRFVRELPKHRGPLASWTAWVAPRTMKTVDAAQSVGISEEHLREINHIPARMMIKAGSTLLVPRGNALLADVSSSVADNATMTLSPDTPPPRKVSLRAGKRDSVASVARRYRVGRDQVAQWNGVAPSAKFAPGQSIVVYVKQAPRSERSASAAAVSVPSAKIHTVSTRATQAHGPRSAPSPTGRAKARTLKPKPATASSARQHGRVHRR